MILLAGLILYGCTAAPEAPAPPRWPQPGLGAVVEVRARLDATGRATAWSAQAWSDAAPEPEAATRGCAPVREVHGPGLAAVDLSAPTTVRLQPDGRGGLAAAGPLRANDARWQVGDVGLVREDGVAAQFDGALRFGDAPALGELELRGDGGAWVRWTPRAGEHLEIDAVNAAGERVRCVGRGGELLVPWTAFDPRAPQVAVSAVREVLLTAPNTAVLRVRTAVETLLSLEHATRWTERVLPSPSLVPGSPGPRRVWRGRARAG